MRAIDNLSSVNSAKLKNKAANSRSPVCMLILACAVVFCFSSVGVCAKGFEEHVAPIKIAVIGHIYGTYAWNSKDPQGNRFHGSPLEKFVGEVNENNYDYVVVTGDIVRGKNIKNFDVIDQFISALDVKEVFFTPGNHDLEYEMLIENYSKRIGYLNKNFVLPDANITLSMINSSGVPEQSLSLDPTGFSLDKDAIKVITQLDSKLFNIVFMHHHLFWDHMKFSGHEPHRKLSVENMISWEKDILPKLIHQNVKMVISGDPTCCKNRASGKINDVAMSFLKNGILHVNASTTWGLDEIHYLELQVGENEQALFHKVLSLN